MRAEQRVVEPAEEIVAIVRTGGGFWVVLHAVGRNFAVLEAGRVRMSGFVTWLVWAFVHVMSLPQLQNRLRVQNQWLWSYVTGQRSSRLILEGPRAAINEVQR